MSDCDVITERLFDAPRERVFRAFSDPAILARWWGPDGVNYPNESVFSHIARPERIEFDHLMGTPFKAIFAFTEHDGKTLLHWTMRFPSAQACARVRDFVTAANGENLDRLEEQLERMTA